MRSLAMDNPPTMATATERLLAKRQITMAQLFVTNLNMVHSLNHAS